MPIFIEFVMKIDPIDTAERVSLCVYAYRQINLKFQTNWKQYNLIPARIDQLMLGQFIRIFVNIGK